MRSLVRAIISWRGIGSSLITLLQIEPALGLWQLDTGVNWTLDDASNWETNE